ncbi:MAG: LysE family transporter [Candidatus Methanofastidiosia archaeon]
MSYKICHMSLTAIAFIFITSFLVGLSGALSPGPVLVATITEASKRGFVAGPLIVFGHAVLELILILSLVFGLGEFLSKTPVAGVIGVLGGIFLIYFGAKLIGDVYKERISLDLEKTEKIEKKNPVLVGILTSISNPYWFLWWATVGAYYIFLAMGEGSLGIAAFYTGHISSDLGWYSLVAFAIAHGRSFFSEKIYIGLILFCGLFLVLLGFYFLYSGINFLI